MNFSKLTDDNWMLFAAKCYDNPACASQKEFKEDLNRIAYIKRLINRYQDTKNIEKLCIGKLINHYIIFINVFGINNGIRLLLFRLNKKYWAITKTILLYLEFWPEIQTPVVDGIELVDINIDNKIANILRNLGKR